MTSHMNVNWGAVGETNRREFNTIARWTLKHDPESAVARAAFSALSKPYKEPAKEQLHRTEVLRASPAAGTALKYAMESRTSQQQQQQGHSITIPPASAMGGHTPQPFVRPGSSPAIETLGATTTTATSGGRRVHCRRKHKRDCPKHILHEMKRRELAIERGEVPPFSPVLDEDRALQDRPEVVGGCHSAVEREQAVLQALPAPNHIGKWGYGMATFLTGIYNEKACKWERRMVTEHPNFDRLDALHDERNRKHHSVRNATKDKRNASSPQSHHVNAADPKAQLKTLEKQLARGDPLIGAPKLLRDEHDTTHHRQMYEMKAHMEKMRLMGTALLRDL